MPLRFAHAGDFHLDEDRYFTDTAQCLEWFVADAIRASVDLFVINGDLTTYKATDWTRSLIGPRLRLNDCPVSDPLVPRKTAMDGLSFTLSP